MSFRIVINRSFFIVFFLLGFQLQPSQANEPASQNQLGFTSQLQLPACNGLRSVAPFSFGWPNYKRRMRELSGGEIRYFLCPSRPSAVAATMREQMKRPPFNLGEVNWVVRKAGTLGIYYNYVTKQWSYLWIIPDPAGNGSRIIAARMNSKGFSC